MNGLFDGSVPPLGLSFDVSAVPAEPVGAGRYTIELAHALAGRPDLKMVLWSRRGDGGRWQGLGTVYARSPDRRVARLTWEQLRLPRLLGASGAAVHHGPHYTMPPTSQVPTVVTVHDLTFFDHPEWHERTKVPVFRRAIHRAAARATALVCPSQRTAELLEARVVVRGRIFVIPHGVDHQRFQPTAPDPATDERHLQALGLRVPYILFLGTLEPRKAVPDLVRAFSSIASRHAEAKLVLAGRPGWGVDEVWRAVGESGLADRVVCTGYVPDDAVPSLLRRAAAVAYPAREEGFGLPALEALACGAPLVTTAGTAMAELSGEAALLAPAGQVDALAAALDAALAPGADVAERRRLGLRISAAYTWARSAAAHAEAYRWAAIDASGKLKVKGGR